MIGQCWVFVGKEISRIFTVNMSLFVSKIINKLLTDCIEKKIYGNFYLNFSKVPKKKINNKKINDKYQASNKLCTDINENSKLVIQFGRKNFSIVPENVLHFTLFFLTSFNLGICLGMLIFYNFKENYYKILW